MIKYCAVVFIFIAATGTHAFAQPRTSNVTIDTLAVYGSHVITGEDFIERFELMPWPMKDNRARIELTKQEFLQSLVAEKLLALEAQRLGFGTDSATMDMRYSLERMFARDELYKRDVQAKIRHTEAELRDGLKKYEWELRMIVYGLVSKKEGDLLLKKVSASRNKEKTFEAFRDSLYTPIDTMTVNFGTTDPVIENAAYAVKVGKFSPPLQADASHWILLKIIDKITNPQFAKQSASERITAVQTIVNKRHEDSLATQTFISLLHPQRAEADNAVFRQLADSVLFVMKNDSAGHYAKNLYNFTPDDCDRLQRTFGQECGKKFVTIESGDMTLGMVLNGLKYNQIVFPSLKPSVVQTILNNNIKTVIQNELLARESMKRNYQQSENVRHDMGMWLDNRLSRLLLKAIVDTVMVSDDEAMSYLRSHFDTPDTLSAQVKLNLRKTMLEEKRKRTLSTFIGGLAANYRVSMNLSRLKKIATTTTSMVTWRTIGFGGRIMAVPMVSPLSEWVREMPPGNNINQ